MKNRNSEKGTKNISILFLCILMMCNKSNCFFETLTNLKGLKEDALSLSLNFGTETYHLSIYEIFLFSCQKLYFQVNPSNSNLLNYSTSISERLKFFSSSSQCPQKVRCFKL